MTFLSVTSCVYTNNKKEESISSSISKKNDTEFNNSEVELLARFNEQNLNIILISSYIKKGDVSFEVKNLAEKLINDHKEIDEKICEVSSKKLMIIPATLFERNYLKNVELDSIKYLEIVRRILNNQIASLTKLSKNTIDVDYKILALQIKVKLNANLKLVESLLYKLQI